MAILCIILPHLKTSHCCCFQCKRNKSTKCWMQQICGSGSSTQSCICCHWCVSKRETIHQHGAIMVDMLRHLSDACQILETGVKSFLLCDLVRFLLIPYALETQHTSNACLHTACMANNGGYVMTLDYAGNEFAFASLRSTSTLNCPVIRIGAKSGEFSSTIHHPKKSLLYHVIL